MYVNCAARVLLQDWLIATERALNNIATDQYFIHYSEHLQITALRHPRLELMRSAVICKAI